VAWSRDSGVGSAGSSPTLIDARVTNQRVRKGSIAVHDGERILEPSGRWDEMTGNEPEGRSDSGASEEGVSTSIPSRAKAATGITRRLQTGVRRSQQESGTVGFIAAGNR
jgi:hypothetical protein